METESNNNGLESGNRLEITERMKDNLLSATSWIKFMNVVACISVGIAAFIGLVLFVVGISLDAMGHYAFVGLIYIAIGAVYLPVVIKGFKFIRQARKACRNNDNEELDGMFDSMRYIAKYMGILCIIALCVYAILIIFAMSSVALLATIAGAMAQ